MAAATGDDDSFFLGTDSAPHPVEGKESACGCAGSYTAHAAIELYAEVFDAAGKLDKLGDFASRRGPRFYGLPVSEERVTLEREEWMAPTELPFGGSVVKPWRAEQPLQWRLVV